ncbi:Proline--tRNA ligase, chloroplastic/mitochondrial [Trebouxia sp. C0010 RCD-2024]
MYLSSHGMGRAFTSVRMSCGYDLPVRCFGATSWQPCFGLRGHRLRQQKVRGQYTATASADQQTATTEVPKSNKQQQQKKQSRQKNGQNAGGKDKKSELAVTPKSEDFARWYIDVVREAQLASNGPVSGTMVIRPYGYALWEFLQQYLDRRFKETGHENAYFPTLIPLSFIQKEASHVEGFAPELALVTKGGGKDLDEPLVVRPTSETMVNHMFAQWIQGHRDLPLKVNQWANVHRWEMRTKPFIRTLEFLWQEGHTAHATAEEAEQEARDMIGIYAEFARSVAAMPVLVGRKSRMESFAGADCTYTIEAMMGDRRALQAGTTHYLGTNFAKAFGTQFLDETGARQHVHQTSFGMSTRMIGGIIMMHGDDLGLRLPPKMAPIQVVIVPIVKKEADTQDVMQAVDALHAAAQQAGLRCKVDASTEKTPGWKFNHYEMKGVPVRVEVGPRDVQQGSCVVSRRDQPGKQGKQFGVPLEPQPFVSHVQGLLQDIQDSLYADAQAFTDSNIVDVSSYEELQAAVAERKWARGAWAGSDEDEAKMKEETGATLRCIPFDQPQSDLTCFFTGSKASEVVIFAKAH